MEIKKKLDNGLLALGVTSYNNSVFYAIYDAFRDENGNDVDNDIDPRCPNEKIIEILAKGYIAHLCDIVRAKIINGKLIYYINKIDYEEYSTYRSDLPEPESDAYTETLYFHYKTIYDNELKYQQIEGYKDYFGDVFEKYRIGFQKYLYKKIKEYKPPLTFDKIILRDPEYVYNTMKAVTQEVGIKKKGKRGIGSANVGRAITELVKEGYLESIKTAELKPLLELAFPQIKRVSWSGIRHYLKY